MRTKANQSGLARFSIVSGTLIALASNAIAKMISLNGSGSSTYVTTAFSFDGARDATSGCPPAVTMLAETFIGHTVSEYAPTSTTCKAPDKTNGTVYDLVESKGVKTYKTGQIFTSAVGAGPRELSALATVPARRMEA